MPFRRRPRFPWQLRTRVLALGERTQIMGVLNLTPDSFSDGGLFRNAEEAVAAGLRMLSEGATLLDLGGESTRPGSRLDLAPQQEADRVLPVLEGILRARPETLLSIDTWHASTARMAIEAGAEIVNDVSGFLWDKDMAATCAGVGCGVILMHTRGRPDAWKSQPPLAPREVVPLVLSELQQRVDDAIAAGVSPARMVLDPGFGFGKVLDENYPLLAELDRLQALGFPLLAGASRKGFLGRSLSSVHQRETPPRERDLATHAAHTAAILAGASIVRVHDVRGAAEAAAIADRILSAAEECSRDAGS